eukprot:Platyproteum_vivax@DN7487_c0_g1_i1.p1
MPPEDKTVSTDACQIDVEQKSFSQIKPRIIKKSPPKLDINNFLDWEFCWTHYLKLQQLDQESDGDLMLSCLVEGVPLEIRRLIRISKCQTYGTAISKVQEYFEDKSMAGISQKINELESMQCQGTSVTEIKDYSTRFTELCIQLEALGAPICEPIKIDKYLRSIKNEGLVTKTLIGHPKSLFEAINYVTDFANYISTAPPLQIFSAQTPNAYHNTTCRYCKKPGHTIEECRKLKWKKEKEEEEKKKTEPKVVELACASYNSEISNMTDPGVMIDTGAARGLISEEDACANREFVSHY